MLQCMRTRAAEWAERVRAWRESGLSAEEFAKAGGGYRATTLRWWASELARRSSPSKTRRRRLRPKVAMARVIRPAKDVEEAIAIRVGGAVIAVRRGFDAQLLRDVMSALGSGR
jgi:hypothetical protein